MWSETVVQSTLPCLCHFAEGPVIICKINLKKIFEVLLCTGIIMSIRNKKILVNRANVCFCNDLA